MAKNNNKLQIVQVKRNDPNFLISMTVKMPFSAETTPFFDLLMIVDFKHESVLFLTTVVTSLDFLKV